LIANVFEKFQVPEYSPEGVMSFYRFIDKDFISNLISRNELELYGYYVNHQIVGVLGIKLPDHISLLFVDEQFHKNGIARALFEHWLDSKREKLAEITVNSSPFAINAYKSLGFSSESSTVLEKDGIKYMPMTHKAST
jgi:GNAT superfamily N-acetyltransferase